MSSIVAEMPALPIHQLSSKIASHPGNAVLEAGARRVPVLDMRLKDKKLAQMIEAFPIQLYPIRTAYLPDQLRATLQIPSEADLFVEALIPECLGPVPLMHWTFTESEVEEMAQANATSGAVVLQAKRKGRQSVPATITLSPYWLDWQGWSGYAIRLARLPTLPDATTLRYMAYELDERGQESAPTLLHTARAYLYALLDDAGAAAEACQEELAACLNHEELPSPGALGALVLLGQLLLSHGEQNEAYAASALALWINPNYQPANLEILPVAEDEQMAIEVLARLAGAPKRPSNYSDLLAQSAERFELKPAALESKVNEYVKSQGNEFLHQTPDWLAESSPRVWVRQLGL